MEKTLTIDGKKVTFKSSGATPIRYKAQFHRDFIKDVFKMRSLEKIQDKKPEDIGDEELEALDFDLFYRLIWVLAKNADKDIPDLENWLDEFEEFPIQEIIGELIDLIGKSIQSESAKKKTHPSRGKK
jgi:hypothetical protein